MRDNEKIKTALMFVAYWTVAIIQSGAFTEGIELWLGWPFVVGFIIWLIASALKPIGALLVIPVTYYGAHSGYGWTWWQAALLAAPMLFYFLAHFLVSFVRRASQLDLRS